MMKKIPYAVANYEKIVDENFHFVDKTRFIHELEKYQVPVFLRPRRFGKSLWCSILECYYDINFADRFVRLFGHTDIGRQPTPAHNSQLVLRFDFSKIDRQARLCGTPNLFRPGMREQLSRFSGAQCGTLRRPGRGRSPHGQRRGTGAACRRKISSRQTPPLHIIIDEYDNFTNQLLTARQDELYRELTSGDSFLRTFYKVIKAGVGDGSVARVFVTGVLPVTMDDLTSGFNIGQIITLEKHVLDMMGFTPGRGGCLCGRDFRRTRLAGGDCAAQVGDDLRAHYNGYRLLPDAVETLYNSTICNFYLNELVINDGTLPTETIDHNLRVDLNWLRRLAGSDAETRALLETLLFDGTLPVDMTMLASTFNMGRFFDPRFLPLSLYYLGMLTFQDEFTLGFPNLTVKTLFTEYFNELEHIEVSTGYTGMFRQFLRDHDLAVLFAGYWQVYLGQIPAQAFDKVNENFFRTTFYELCTRYLSRRNSLFAIEVNHPGGRSDWEAIGRPHTAFENQALLIEFKHFPRAEGERLGVLGWAAPRPEEVAQVTGYAADLQRRYPRLTVRRHIVYTVACAGFRFFTLGNSQG